MKPGAFKPGIKLAPPYQDYRRRALRRVTPHRVQRSEHRRPVERGVAAVTMMMSSSASVV